MDYLRHLKRIKIKYIYTSEKLDLFVQIASLIYVSCLANICAT